MWTIMTACHWFQLFVSLPKTE